MHRTRAVVLVAVILNPAAAWAQGIPLGPEFRVNTYTTVSQAMGAVASDSGGNFVVVWRSNDQDGSGRGVFGQRYAASGAPVSPEFRINTYTTQDQHWPAVAADPSGNFVVVWNVNASGLGAIFGQRYDSSGAPLGPEFRVSTYGAAFMVNASGPSVATDAAGNFVVVWKSSIPGGSAYDISGQRYSSAGAPLGSEFRVNTYTTFNQEFASVAADPAGNFVVVWDSDNQDGSIQGIFGQRYASSGTPLGAEFRVNTYTTFEQYRPSVAADPSGNFVVVWQSDDQDGSSRGVFGQRYDGSGVPLGAEFRVNTYTTLQQNSPSVAADSSGNFVVTWDSVTQDGSIDGIFGQRFGSSGTPLGPEFRVNTFTTSYQGDPAVAADPLGRFVVVWTSYLQDGGDLGVYGQRYDVMVPVELTGFGVE